MTPRNAIISAVLLALAIVGGISFYAQWELKRFTASLPMPPVAVPEQENTGPQRQLPKTGDVSVNIYSETDAVFDDTGERLSEITDALSADTDIGETESLPSLEGTPADVPIEEVRVSPFGFGPYPEVPPDFPLIVSWNRPEEVMARFPEGNRRQFELMDRVFIRLWNQGHTDFNGGTLQNGLVLPLYPNTVYLHYEENWEEVENGDVHSVYTDMIPGPGVSEAEQEQILNGETPRGIRILDFSDGIEPYTFLGLHQLK